MKNVNNDGQPQEITDNEMNSNQNGSIHQSRELVFPKGFLWGTATAAHQIEGNNKNCDWWDYEQTKDTQGRTFPSEPSLDACDSYNRYEEDFDHCVQLNNNAVRISVEWARIEPEEGVFDENEIAHYKKVLKAAKDRGLKTFVTLHHFTSPMWFANKGGWHSLGAPKRFERYAKKCAQEFDPLIDTYLTINEPQVYALLSYVGVFDWINNDVARWTPAKSNYFLSLVVQLNFIRAHKAAYKAIKSEKPNAIVGIVKSLTWWETHPTELGPLDSIAVHVLNYLGRDFFLKPLKNHLDILGLNYYFTNRIKNLRRDNPSDYTSDLGWWINPGGLGQTLEYLKCFKIPVYVTENGIADAKDKYRKQFLRDHLISVAKAIENGADVRGYFHWSLLDNYEWHHGFWPRFGLVEIDRDNNLERKPRPSFYYYADICKHNRVRL